MYRILCDPTTTEGGAVVPQTQAAEKTVTPPPAAPPAPPAKIELTADEYKELQSKATRLAEKEADDARKLHDAEDAKIKALAEKGDVQKALDTQRDKYESDLKVLRSERDRLEGERLSDRKETAIATALSGVDFASPFAAAHARRLMELDYEAVRDSAGSIVVRHKSSHKTAVEGIKEWLASEDAGHFLKGSTKGGNAPGNTHQSSGETKAPDDPIGRQLRANAARNHSDAPGLSGTRVAPVSRN